MTTTITITPAEPRQVARELPFDATLAPYINWDHIAASARELGAHFEARYAADGACTVTLFWAYRADELEPELPLEAPAVDELAALEPLAHNLEAARAKGGAQ